MGFFQAQKPQLFKSFRIQSIRIVDNQMLQVWRIKSFCTFVKSVIFYDGTQNYCSRKQNF